MVTSSINGVVHVFALVFFGVLFFLVLKRKGERDLLRDYLRGDMGKRVQVDWPLRFLSRFCRALDIPFCKTEELRLRSLTSFGMTGLRSLTSFGMTKPKRLRKELLFETLLLYGIDEIQYEVTKHQDIHVKILISKELANAKILEAELSSALGVHVHVLSLSKK